MVADDGWTTVPARRPAGAGANPAPAREAGNASAPPPPAKPAPAPTKPSSGQPGSSVSPAPPATPAAPSPEGGHRDRRAPVLAAGTSSAPRAAKAPRPPKAKAKAPGPPSVEEVSSTLDGDALAAAIAGASDATPDAPPSPSDAALRASAAIDWLCSAYAGAALPPLPALLPAVPARILATAASAFDGAAVADVGDLALALANAAVSAPAGPDAGVCVALATLLRARPDAAPLLGASAAARGTAGPSALLSPSAAPTLAWALAQPAGPGGGAFKADRPAALAAAAAAFLPGLVGLASLSTPSHGAARLSPAAAEAGVALLEQLLAPGPPSPKGGVPAVPAGAADAVTRACWLADGPPATTPSSRRRPATAGGGPPSAGVTPSALPSVRGRLLALRPALRAAGVVGAKPAAWVPPAIARAAATASAAGDAASPAAAEAADDALHAANADADVALFALRGLASSSPAALARLVAALAVSADLPLDKASPAAGALARFGQSLETGAVSSSAGKAVAASLATAGAALAMRARGGSPSDSAAALSPARPAPHSDGGAAPAASKRHPPRKSTAHMFKKHKGGRSTAASAAVAGAALCALVGTLVARTSVGQDLLTSVSARAAMVTAHIADAVRRFLATLATPSEAARLAAAAAA